MNSVYDLLKTDIEVGIGIGELKLGKSREQLKEVFHDFDQLKKDTKLKSSINLDFGNCGYLCAIGVSNHYKGTLYGLIEIGALYSELSENYCNFDNCVDCLFIVMMKNSDGYEDGIYLNFNPFPNEYNMHKSKLEWIEISNEYYRNLR